MAQTATELQQDLPEIQQEDLDVSSGYLLKREILEVIERRAHLTESEIAEKFPLYPDWKAGKVRVTPQQVNDLADFTYEPYIDFITSFQFGHDYLVTDFRNVDGVGVIRKEIDLVPSLRQRMDKSYLQQEWMRDHLMEYNRPVWEWVGSLKAVVTSPREGAQALRNILNLEFGRFSNSNEYLEKIVIQAGQAGVMVQPSNLVDRFSKRPLDPDDFNCFQLLDDYAPLVFVHLDASDDIHVFSILHGLAHLMIGEAGIDMVRVEDIFDLKATELWCSAVALEFLMPVEKVVRLFNPTFPLEQHLDQVASEFSVSPFVALVRLRQLQLIDDVDYQKYYGKFYDDYYHNRYSNMGFFTADLHVRGIGEPFARAVAEDFYYHNEPVIETSHVLDTVYSSLDEHFQKLIR